MSVAACRSPEVSIAGRAAKAAIASPMKPSRQTRRAASICASRSPADVSLSSRRQVAASAGFLNSSPGRGAGRYTAAEVVHSVSNSSRTAPIVAPIASTAGCPCSAYPMAYASTSARDFVP